MPSFKIIKYWFLKRINSRINVHGPWWMKIIQYLRCKLGYWNNEKKGYSNYLMLKDIYSCIFNIIPYHIIAELKVYLYMGCTPRSYSFRTWNPHPIPPRPCIYTFGTSRPNLRIRTLIGSRQFRLIWTWLPSWSYINQAIFINSCPPPPPPPPPPLFQRGSTWNLTLTGPAVSEKKKRMFKNNGRIHVHVYKIQCISPQGRGDNLLDSWVKMFSKT